jgi:8-oxo-dGTP diphosphatase
MPLSLEKVGVSEHRRLDNHFTASGLVIEQGHILLVHHKKLSTWLPPGGHLQPGEMPHEAAVREVFEETGVAGEVVAEPMPKTGNIDYFFLPQPFCIHAVHAIEKDEHLYHLDMVFLLKASFQNGLLPALSYTDEVLGARWVRLDDIGM